MRTCDQIKHLAEFMSNDEVQEAVIALIDVMVERIPEDTPSIRIVPDAKLAATCSTLQGIEVHARKRYSELFNMRCEKRTLRSQ